MKSGLYRVHFQTPLGSGSGVVFASNGRLWGGDAGMYYVGTYSEEGNNLTADISIDRHTSNAGVTSVFGADQVTIKINGQVDGDNVKASGTSPQAPGITFSAVMSFISE
ncbi:GrlR family regulatory protein [Oryzicola mucosus]|uniref:Type III secretion system (T3SS) negative regulator GrlR n=1 Tax=Oryzicola mucosus TaxID=2767425 RepID=A0A8J6PWX1_9HYPH|nr:GrlR family regulatory protein [Oryzicola mucosus]MBD0416521.1 hypothetical protein [Oryzicola mucosus]